MSPKNPSAIRKPLPERPLLAQVAELGQSIWLDEIDRDLLESGGLRELVGRGLRGLTSNPAIFEKAMATTDRYDSAIAKILAAEDLSAGKLFERLATEDIREAADVLAPVYRDSDGADGFVSLEVSPRFARDATRTAREARRLWSEVDRPNLLIKVPGTPECLPAIRELIREGINVNVTLLFSRELYRRAADAYLGGLEDRLADGNPIDRAASVASFFVSRIDVAIDALLDKNPDTATLRGKAGIANARLAYRDFCEILSSPRWQKLASRGARPQRVLWASTGTKNPSYSDIMYVESLIAPDTVNTLPAKTLQAFEDHGTARLALTPDDEIGPRDAEHVMRKLEHAGIRFSEVTDQLLVEGIEKFNAPYGKLLASLERKRRAIRAPGLNRQVLALPAPLEGSIEKTLDDWKISGKVRKLWSGDASLWTGHDESRFLGWLTIVERQLERLPELEDFSAEIYNKGFLHAVLLGMGGSSLCPEVLAMTFRPDSGHPHLRVLDSTDSEQIRALEKAIDYERTLFIVSSKSGTTLEPSIFRDYFFDKLKQEIGAERAANCFVAITDPGSPLDRHAKEAGYLRVFHGEPSIGGRYSALSDFGLVPAACMGLDIRELLTLAERMAQACGPEIIPEENPGVTLGVVLGTLGREGRDKVTFFSSPEVWDIGAWLEQLLAESTGKNGRGLIPVAGETIGPPDAYGNDRQFYYLRLEGGSNAELDEKVQALIEAGHPVVRIDLTQGKYSIGQEFMRWEIATSVAGSILGVNPFDQPDVEAAKEEARKLTSEFERTGKLPQEEPLFQGGALSFYSHTLSEVISDRSLDGALRALMGSIRAGDYFALLAFIERRPEHERILEDIRLRVRDACRAATCLGFGPRFLHSTGQAYKGGPDTGVFLQLTRQYPEELDIPGHRYGFATVITAQARGDYEVLTRRRRRILRIDVGNDVHSGLIALSDAVRKIL